MKDAWAGSAVPPGLKRLLASVAAFETHWTPGKRWTSETAA